MVTTVCCGVLTADCGITTAGAVVTEFVSTGALLVDALDAVVLLDIPAVLMAVSGATTVGVLSATLLLVCVVEVVAVLSPITKRML